MNDDPAIRFEWETFLGVNNSERSNNVGYRFIDTTDNIIKYLRVNGKYRFNFLRNPRHLEPDDPVSATSLQGGSLFIRVRSKKYIYIYTYETKKDYVTESDSHNDRWSLDRIFTRGFLSHA